MALNFADPGGEYYFSLGINAAGVWSEAGAANLVNNAPVGRTTQYAIAQGSNSFFIGWFFPANFASVIMGAAIYIPIGGFTANSAIMQLFDGTTLQVDLRIDASNHLVVTRNGTVLGTSTNVIVNGSGWHYFELKATINSSTGAMQVWFDGVSWINVSGQNTQNTANAYATKMRFAASSPTQTIYFKDIYMLDTGTGNRTSVLGDVAVLPLYPNAAGVNQQFAANTGTQTSAVQDGTTHTGTWPDSDTTYISDATSGHISDFGHQALSLTGTIYGVIHMSFARKDDAGARSFNQVCLSTGTTETSTTYVMGNTYQYYADILEHDPHTAADWGVSGLNAATFGVKVT
jgi:hypothetical protein